LKWKEGLEVEEEPVVVIEEELLERLWNEKWLRLKEEEGKEEGDQARGLTRLEEEAEVEEEGGVE
jgi:hypothetical protein